MGTHNISPLVVFLASDAAADVSGQIFVVWGTRAHLMEGFTLANTLDRGEGRFTPQELITRKDELFAGRRSKVPHMGFGQCMTRRRRSPAGPMLVDQLRFMADGGRTHAAYIDLDTGTAITFREWDARSNQVARWLVANGVSKGDRVALYLENEYCLRWITAYAGVHKAGAVMVPVNTRLSIPEVMTILGHAEITAMFTTRAARPRGSGGNVPCRGRS